MTTPPFTVELDTTPGRRQGEESFVLHRDGGSEHIVLHDYARVYAVPGLYEEVVQHRLECASPSTVSSALVEAAGTRGVDVASLRAFDLGAGNGVVGEELSARGVTVVVGADGIPEARDAAHRDRPGLYAHYLVGERLDAPAVADLVRSEGLTALVAAGAVGAGHVPIDELSALWSAFPPGSFLALTFTEDDAGDVESMLTGDPGTETVVRRRFRHRVGMDGRELYYVVLGATRM